jgi:energy-coupling factor transporter ATP-binding protein EcfA2
MNNTTEKLPAVISKSEIELLIRKSKKKRHALGIALMAHCGLRVSEMCSLRIKDVFLTKNFLRFNGKGGKERIVPINSTVERMIENYLDNNNKISSIESYLIGGSRKSWHTYVCKLSRTVLGRTDVHPHTLRHSFATNLYDNKIPIERISQLLGHTSLDTTMIYSHISLRQKKIDVNTLDTGLNPSFALIKKIVPPPQIETISLNKTSTLTGREKEVLELEENIKKGISTVLHGEKGIGKSSVIKFVSGLHKVNSVYIEEFKNKNTLIQIILSGKSESGVLDMNDPIIRDSVRALKKLTVEELLAEVEKSGKVVFIDEITSLSRPAKKTLSTLSTKLTLISTSTKRQDKKLYKAYMDIKPLKRHETRIILSEMIEMPDLLQKEKIVDDILLSTGNNIKEAVYMVHQLQLGRRPDEIQTEERESNQVSIAPAMLIMVLFFAAYVLKSYAAAMVALSYAILVIFRLIFYKYIFMPASSNKKQG